ncbi:ATP-binding protein [Aquirhabdus sp.]|uniref:sensor histidine kinase n=1 Tax=Aquirhabdus sp. TaxID=2824160 RepID=UPI00396D02E4
MKLIRSSAFFLAVGYVFLGILALGMFATPLWYAWRVTINDGRAELLQADTQRFNAVFQRDGAMQLINFINARVGMQIPGERILILADSDKHLLAGNMPAWPQNVSDKPGIYTISMNLGGTPAQVVVVRSYLPNGYNLLVGRDLSRFAPLETRFWYGLSGAILILIIDGMLGGLLIRRALMFRIQGIDQTVSAIVQGDLGHRLVTKSSGDELDTLSITINQLLDQIEQLIHGIRNVSNTIAHDLRTPLAELRSRLEVLALTQPTPEETFAEIDAAVSDVDRVIRIFNALLRLAEIDAGLRRSGFVLVDAVKIVTDAVDFYLPVTELNDIELIFHHNGGAPVLGDPVLLAQAVSNLMDNALKYVGSHGMITVEVSSLSGETVQISIADNGPGIPDAEKPKVTERFFRGRASNDMPGVGLGLTLVDAVARLHGGRLELEDNHPGLKARLVIG